MLTRVLAVLARTSHADVFTPDGDAAIVTAVAPYDDLVTVIVSRSGDEKVYPFTDLEPSRDLLAMA